MTLEQRTEDEIFDTLASALLDKNPDANPRSETSLANATLRSIARTLATEQEPRLRRAYNAGLIKYASGADLTQKARNLGVFRQPATQATGVVTFESDSPVTTDRTIPAGTIVETVEDDPVQFETTAQTSLRYYDGFESGSLDNAYSGDTGNVTVQSSTVDTGSYALKLDATNGTQVYRTDVTTEQGQTLDVALNPNGNDVRYLFAVDDSSPKDNHYRVTLDGNNNDVKLSVVDGGSATEIDKDTSATLDSEWHSLVVDWRTDGECTVEVFDSNDDEVTTISGTDTTYESGGLGYESGDANGDKFVDEVTSSAVTANIEASEAGADGSVGANAIGAMPSPPTGVDTVNNYQPTGDTTLADLNGDSFVSGRDRESDIELRQRTLDTGATTKGPQASSLELALIETEDVQSSHVETNQTSSTVDGLDPYSTEVVVLGGDINDIADTLIDFMSLTTLLRLQGGVNGTKKTTTRTVDIIDEDRTIPITRPSKITFDLELDIVHTTEYAGNGAVKDAIVEYVGGTFLDDSTTFGRVIGENVLVNQIENAAEEVLGVEYANKTLLDTNDDNSDDTTTDSDGVPVLEISDSEVARLDAEDITLSTTER